MVDDFELRVGCEGEGYPRNLLEFCCSRALENLCRDGAEKMAGWPFNRLTFDMMLAWECPSNRNSKSLLESASKEKEDRVEEPLKVKEEQMHDDVPLFYSDLMPLLVDEEQSVGEEAFVWLASLFPLAADIVNARFAFEAFTECTGHRLHFPAYDRYLKEMDQCIKYLEKQSTPTGVELAEDEFILHVEGTARTQRVIRHIGSTSWPGRLTLTNHALYFEASGTISYENAVKIDLSEAGVDHLLRPGSTGPWGAPLFDKAMIYESSKLAESIILEFPELTSSTRRDHWLALTKEIILLHQFLAKFQIKSPENRWEMHARTVLGIIRLHAVREMLRLSPPVPRNFLIFTLFEDLPKGDYVLEELFKSSEKEGKTHPLSASSVLKVLNLSSPKFAVTPAKEGYEYPVGKREILESLETTIGQVRAETKDIVVAKASLRGIQEEGITDSVLLLVEMVKPVKNVLPWARGVLRWERPIITLVALVVSLVIIYEEWAGYVISMIMLWVVGVMLWTRRMGIGDEQIEITVPPSPGQSTMDSLVSAQHGFISFQDLVQKTNIVMLKSWSILVSKAPKHANMVIAVLTGLAFFFAMVPLRFVLMGLTAFLFFTGLREERPNNQGNRRLKEWWDTIPVVAVKIIRTSS
ncbi:argH (DUF639) [Wolffia australiana]